MSNELAIAAVTASLRHLLQPAIGGSATITTLPLDKARGSNTTNQINLYLYHGVVNAAWRNRDMPRQVQPNETGQPALPLDLYYLVTAYGGNDEDILAHRLLGSAMRILHDHPLLNADDISAAVADPLIAAIDPGLGDNDLASQIERVRFTWQPLSLDEISKLWSGFQMAYRMSVAYEASVVLIESRRPAKTPLPVLTRGPADSGVAARPDLVSPVPTLLTLQLPGARSSARPGDTITVQGQRLNGAGATARFVHPLVAVPVDVAPQPGGTDTQVSVVLPPDVDWPAAGLYALTLLITPSGGGAPVVTNALFLPLAPSVTVTPNPATRDAEGAVTLTAACGLPVLPPQRVGLLLGDREVPAPVRKVPTESLDFAVPAAQPGLFFVRLRVDGVDSLLIDDSVSPPVFDTTQQVTIS